MRRFKPLSYPQREILIFHYMIKPSKVEYRKKKVEAKNFLSHSMTISKFSGKNFFFVSEILGKIYSDKTAQNKACSKYNVILLPTEASRSKYLEIPRTVVYMARCGSSYDGQ